ncbi:hypothetical protein GCM10010413_20040 [Promicromonospora sukumoe]
MGSALPHSPHAARDSRAGNHQLVPLSVAAEVFCVSVKTIRRRIADGTVTGYRIGRLIRVDLDELRARLAVPVASAHRRDTE